MTAAARRLAIIIPIRNEQTALPTLLQHLAPLRERGAEILVVDGASRDASTRIARQWGTRLVQASASNSGRARQMNLGAGAAQADVLWFLHADTLPPADADRQILATVAGAHGDLAWGWFDVEIVGRSRWLPVIAWSMNRRARVSGIATGDQGLFMTRHAFDVVGGFPDQPLMEDIEMSHRLGKHARPHPLRSRVRTSGRRWDERGAQRTMVLMWRLRWAYWRGVSPERLWRDYQ
jgi:rSAM/selenodomain-associated transferase 2